MAITNEYLKTVFDGLKQRNADQPEFLQAVEEVLESLQPVVQARPELEKAGIIERLVEPERVIMFRVPWSRRGPSSRRPESSRGSSSPRG